MFDTKVSQAELAKEFAVAEKKLHMAVSGHKYDPGKKPSKCGVGGVVGMVGWGWLKFDEKIDSGWSS